MKKILFGVFAHPDDEAFGPSGMLYNAAQDGTEVHLIVVTDGAAGVNSADYADLAAVRLSEWHASGNLIGAKTMKALGYGDGTLSNNLYLEIAQKLIEHIRESITEYAEPTELTILTIDPCGITGHLDHIAVSMMGTYAYLKLRDEPPRACTVGKLKYACIANEIAPSANTNWLYMPAGREKSQCDEIVDVNDIYDKKVEIMRAHATQKHDMESILSRGRESVATECYWYYKD